MHITRTDLIDTYLEWANDYITIHKFAEHKGLTPEQAARLIELSRDVAKSQHPEE